jgi:hypothetical protein
VTATAILDLERAGFTREQVEALARWHETGIDLSHLATKADLADVRTELAELRGDLGREIAAVRGDLGRDIAGARGEIATAKVDTIRWVVGVGVVQLASVIGLAFAILRLFPGGHP